MTSGNRRGQTPEAIDVVQSRALQLAGAAAAVTLLLALYGRSLDLLRTDIPFRASNGRYYWFAVIVASIALGLVAQRLSWHDQLLANVQHRAPLTVAYGAAILPGLVMFAALQFVGWDSRAVIVVAAPLLAGAGVFTAAVVRHYLLTGDAATLPGARLVHLALTTGVAFLSLSLTRNWMAGPLYTLVVATIIAGLLLVQAFDGVRAYPIRRVAYALAGACVLGQAAYALSYWPPSGWYDGAMLTACFAVILLVVDAILTRRISTDIVARYAGAGVGVCGLLWVIAR